MIVLLGGCAILGPDFVKPAAPVANDWLESDPRLKRDAVELRTLSKIFEDPVLDRLIDAAQAQNLSLKLAGLRILEVRAALGIALRQRYLQVQQAGGEATFERSSKNQVNAAGADSSAGTFDVGFDAAWKLDLWRRFQRGVESADASLLASVAGDQVVLVSLTAEVANAYLTVRTFEERIASEGGKCCHSAPRSGTGGDVTSNLFTLVQVSRRRLVGPRRTTGRASTDPRGDAEAYRLGRFAGTMGTRWPR